VVLEARGIALADVEAELAARTRQSGLAEKAARPRKVARRVPGKVGARKQG
jgi:phosphoribosyl-ATP pyrophosphohydrolase